jgi:hypothetical protein
VCSHSTRVVGVLKVYCSTLLVLIVSNHIFHTIIISLMAGKEVVAAVNGANKTRRSNTVPGSDDTEDNNSNERTSSYISTNVIHQPADNEVTGDMQPVRKQEKAARKRKKKLLEGARREAIADFVARRKEVLDRVPEDYKNMFGQVGFVKWGESTLAALIVSPYSVPTGEGSSREKWLNMLDSVSALVLVQHHSA